MTEPVTNQAAVTTEKAASGTLARLAKSSLQQIFVFAALVIIYIFFLFAAPNFAQFTIVLDIIQQSAYIGVMALGATFVIATGGIDLSSGTGMTLVAVMAGGFLSGGWPIWGCRRSSPRWP